MTPVTSVSFYQPAFNDFLYAPVDAGSDGNPLSVLSALARLGVDPWVEAAKLAALPREGARQRLAGLLERLPNRPWVRSESGPIVDRLLKLLPAGGTSDAPATPMMRGTPGTIVTPQIKMLIYIAIAVYVIALGVHRASLWQSQQPNVPEASTSQPRIPQTVN